MRNLNKLLASALALVVPLCTWAQTETEPNNSAGTADPLAYNTAMAGSSGTCAPTDVSADWYSITSTAQGVLRIQTSMSNTGGTDVPVSILLRNSAQTVIATFSATAGANGVAVNETFTHLCSGIGLYYISIANPSPSVCTNYALTYDLLAPAYANDSEPNGSAGQALDTLDAGVLRDGQINFEYGDAADWHRILAPNDGVITVTVLAEHAGASPGTMSLRLRNSSSSILQTWTVNVGASGAPITNTFTRNCTGAEVHYFLTLESPTVCGTSYRMSYSVAAPFYADDAEPNQSAGPAIIANAGTNYDGRLSFEYDNTSDWYRLQAPNDGLMTVTVLAEHAGALPSEMTVNLRDNASTIIETWTVVIGAGGVPVSNIFTHTCSGTEAVYYLDVVNPDDCGVSYRFNYSVAAPLHADDQEPNGAAGQAIIANAGTDYEGRLTFNYDNASDWYRLQAPNDGVISVAVMAENAGPTTGTMTVHFRNSASSVLETWTANVGANGSPATTTFTRNCTGTEDVYFLDLRDPTVCGVSYRFNYMVAAPVFTDDVEPNGAAGQAIIANAGTDYEGRLTFNYDNASDWYRLQAPNDGVLTVTVLAENAGPTAGTMTVLFRNSSSSVLETWTANVGANGSPATTTFTRNCTGTEAEYYLDLRDPTVCGVSYRFNYTVAAPLYADDAEPNQSAGQAIGIDLNAAPAFGRASFNYDNTNDWFGVSHPGGVLTFNVRAENAGAAGTMTLRIRNSSSTIIATNATAAVGGGGVAASSSIATAGPVAAGTYYFELESPTVCGVSYRLDCYDDDNDGVCNSGDLCANTPTGEGVNSNGCSCSQLIVDDGDVCTLDACLNGNVTNTFEDADGDLTCDANDGCPNDPNKIAPGQCGCGVADTDTDGDLTADCNDGCPNDPNKVAPGACGCGVADTDSDNDGTPDCNDACPLLANLVNGDPCDDGNANTINDVVTNCICAGTLLGNDCEGVPGGPAQPGTACNDNDDCTTGDVYDANCLCTGTFADADGDGTCDADDVCPGGPEPGTACNDNDDCTTGDVIDANCNCTGTFADADGDGTCDAEDVCPGGPEPGTPCDDFDANTTNDVITANCTCQGVNVNCTEDLVMTITLDAFGSQTTWEITDALTSTVVASGGPYSDGTPGATVSTNLCLPSACYNLVVNDGMGDGIAAGGYVLTDDLGRRIIDANGDFGSSSSVTITGGDFCVPLGPTFVKPNWCDRTDLVPSSFIYCQGVAGASGYQFWFFDPHGSYSRRILRPSTDCRLNNLQTNPAPFNLPLNVCVRPLVGGNYLPFGKVCRIIVNNPGGSFRDLSSFSTDAPHLSLYPNPVKDETVFIRMEGLDSDIEVADITVYDAIGKTVLIERAPMAQGTLNHVLNFGTTLGEGLYLVQVNAADQVFTQRLVVQ